MIARHANIHTHTHKQINRIHHVLSDMVCKTAHFSHAFGPSCSVYFRNFVNFYIASVSGFYSFAAPQRYSSNFIFDENSKDRTPKPVAHACNFASISKHTLFNFRQFCAFSALSLFFGVSISIRSLVIKIEKVKPIRESFDIFIFFWAKTNRQFYGCLSVYFI